MSTTTLAASGLKVKPNVAIAKNGEHVQMRKPKKIHWDQVRSPLQVVFVKRINAELSARDLSDNEFSELCEKEGFTIGQSSVSRLTGGRQDPSLEMVFRIAKVLKLSSFELMMETQPVGKPLQTDSNVRELPKFPSMLGQKGKSSGTKAHDRGKRRA